VADHVRGLARALRRLGLEQAFGVVGSGASLELAAAFEEAGGAYFPVAHEAAAAFMAGACCRAGIPKALALGIKGPGLVNFLPGILSNAYEGRPALTVSEAYPPSSPAHRTHKRADHRALLSPLVKGLARVDGREETVSQLLALAAEEVPGPVHLELSPVPVENREPAGPVGPPKPPPVPIDPARLEAALDLVRRARRPVLVLGSLAARRMAAEGFQGLEVPVLTTAAAKGCVDETGPNAGGVITGEVKDLAPEAFILAEADLALGIGLRNTEVVLADPFPCPLICLDQVQAGLQEGFAPEHILVAADLPGLAGPFLAELEPKSWGLDLVAERKTRIEAEVLGHDWLPGPVFRALQDRLGPAAGLCPDTGLFCTVAETVWQAREPGDFCGSSVGRFMGSALPTAIGVSLSSPGRPVVCAMGDGGVRPYLAELKLAVEHGLPILFLLLSDGGYGTVASGAPPGLISHHAHGISRPSWWRAMEGMGCPARPVGSAAELDRALDGWSPERGPFFVEASFDPAAYRSMTAKLR